MSKISKNILKGLMGARTISPRALFIMLDMVQKCESMLMELAFRKSNVEEAAQTLLESMWIIDNNLAHAHREKEITNKEYELISQHAEMITDCAHSIAKGEHPYEISGDNDDLMEWMNRESRGTGKPFTNLPPPSKCDNSKKR